MQRDIRKYFFDIRQAAELLSQFTHGKTFGHYETDPLLRSAVERQFMIVGEALYQAVKLQPDLVDQISKTREIINFRHVLVHGYAVVEHRTVWGILENNLATLRSEVEKILEALVEKPGS